MCAPFRFFHHCASGCVTAFCMGSALLFDPPSRMLPILIPRCSYHARGTAFVALGRQKGVVKVGGGQTAGVRSAFFPASPDCLVAKSHGHSYFSAENADYVPTVLCKNTLQILRDNSQGSGSGFFMHE